MLVWLLTTVLLHPVHETVSEIEWNGKTQRLEVALRLHVLDEQRLQRRFAKQEQPFDQWAPAYLKKKYRVDPPKQPGKASDAKYHWVGRKPEGSHVWWFFEIEPKDGAAPEKLDQRMFFEHDERYKHRVVVLRDGPDQALNLNVLEPAGKLEI